MPKIETDYPYNLIREVIGDEPAYLQNLDAVFAMLSEREHEMLIYRYRDGRTLEQCAKLFGITRERARQIIAKAIRKMRHPVRARMIRAVPLSDYAELKAEAARLQNELDAALSELQLIRGNEPKPVHAWLTKIDDVDFSVRTYNCLVRAGKQTMRDLVDMTYEDLTKIRNMGRKSCDEVVKTMARLGLSLAESDA